MIEFRGEDGGVLSCHELRDDCKHCRPGCWPQHIRDAVPLPDGVKEFVVLKGGAVIHEQAIPEPPEVKVRCRRNQKEEIELQWSSDQEGEVWYLVHWLDDDGKTWRGVSPRTQEQEMTLPLRQFPHAEQLAFRVLATAGLATGVGTCAVDVAAPPLPTVEIIPGRNLGDTGRAGCAARNGRGRGRVGTNDLRSGHPLVRRRRSGDWTREINRSSRALRPRGCGPRSRAQRREGARREDVANASDGGRPLRPSPRRSGQ